MAALRPIGQASPARPPPLALPVNACPSKRRLSEDRSGSNSPCVYACSSGEGTPNQHGWAVEGSACVEVASYERPPASALLTTFQRLGVSGHHATQQETKRLRVSLTPREDSRRDSPVDIDDGMLRTSCDSPSEAAARVLLTLEGRPPVGTPCRLAPGRGVLLSHKRIAKHNPDPAHIAASDAAEEMLLSVCPEPGTPNDFGIFNRHQGNPTAAYIDGASTVEGYFRNSRKGYCTMKLKGQHWTEIRWDRDTMAPPPDDLRSVHVSAPDGQHGWLFVPELVEAPAEKKPKSATKKGGAKS